MFGSVTEMTVTVRETESVVTGMTGGRVASVMIVATVGTETTEIGSPKEIETTTEIGQW